MAESTQSSLQLQRELDDARRRIAGLEAQLAAATASGLLGLNTILQQSHDLIATGDLQGTILYINPGGGALLGAGSPDEVIGRPIRQFHPPADADRVLQEYVPAALTQGQWRGENRVRRLDGTVRTVDQTIFPLFDENHRMVGIATIMADITERRQAEDALRQAEERYRSLIESSDSSIALVDADARIVYATERTAQEMGMTREAMIGLTLPMFLATIGSSAEPNSAAQVIKTGSGMTVDTKLSVRGEERWYRTSIQPVRDGNGRPILALLNATNITAHKQQEDQMRRANQRLQILHAIDTGIVAGAPVQPLVETALRELRRIIPCQQARVDLIDQAAGSWSTLADALAGSRSAAGSTGSPLPAWLATYRDDRPTVVSDLSLLAAANPADLQLIQAGMLSSLRVLLAAQGQPLGLLTLAADVPDFFTPEHQEFAVQISRQFAIALHQAELRAQIEQHTHDLERRVQERTLELERARTRVEAILSSSSDGILLVDSRQGIQQANPAAEALFACPEGSLLGRQLLDLADPQHSELLESAVHATLAGDGIQRLEIQALRGDTSFTAELGLARVRQMNGDCPGLVCLVRDVTERRQQQETLRESEERYRSVIAAMREGLIMQGSDGQIYASNAAAEEILGLTADQMMGRTPLDPRWHAVHEDMSPFPWQTHPAMVTVRTGEPQSNVVIGVHKVDGTLTWILVNAIPIFDPGAGTPRAAVSTFTDITRHKQAEAAAQALGQRLELAAMAGDIGIWDWNVRDDILIWDERNFALFGVVPDTFCGRVSGWENTLHPDDRERAVAEINAALRGEAPFDTEFRIVLPDGGIRHVKGNGTVVRDEEGQPVRMIGVNWDMTKVRRSEEVLRQALQKEIELNELKSRFVSMASHEFRTPLASILATTESLRAYRDRMDRAQIDKRLDKIRQHVHHLRDLMDDVLALARFQSGRERFTPSEFDLDGLCRDILEEFDPDPTRSPRIRYTCTPQPLPVTMDPKLMRQIISNLVSNATKYSPPDTPVVMEVAHEGERLVLRICDQGIGIAPEDQRHVFDAFFRGANVATVSGTGLGLAITKQAVDAHGGAIRVESQPGRGTTFTVELPLRQVLREPIQHGSHEGSQT